MKTNFRIVFYVGFLLIILIFTNCRSIKVPEVNDSILILESLELINGYYKNVNTDLHIERFSEHFNWKGNRDRNKLLIDDSNAHINLEIIDEKQIRVSLIGSNGNSISTIFKYGYKANGITIKCCNNNFFQGVPLIFYRTNCEALWIGINKEKNVELSFNGEASGGIFILIFGTPIVGHSIYERIK